MSRFIERAIAAVRCAGEIRREERVVAGHAGAVVWVIASVSVIAMALALPAAQVHRDVVVAESSLGRLEFARLISTAITNIEDRAALAAPASTDALTDVANHRAFYERLAADMARSRRHGSPLSVAMIDVDRFKLINDARGHEAGDEILVRVAECLRTATRAEDMLARVGGDEFAWILPQTAGEAEVQAVERARVAMASTTGELPQATLSVGVCDTRHTSDPTELVRLADRALYSSKERGRDQVRLYAPASTDELAAT